MSKKDPMLSLRDMSVRLPDDTSILQSIDMSIEHGQCHVIMGPNGSGKSSLLSSIMGLDPYVIASGELLLKGESIVKDTLYGRAAKGVFMSFQSPVSIPGVSNLAFYKAIVQQKYLRENAGAFNTSDFMKNVKEACEIVGLPESFLRRDLNDDFSGGERKRNELLQMLLLEPDFVMLDEIDSGLDIDAMRNFTDIIKAQRARGTTFLIVTHYHKFMESLEVDHVHVLLKGRKVATGQLDILSEIENNGYKAWA